MEVHIFFPGASHIHEIIEIRLFLLLPTNLPNATILSKYNMYLSIIVTFVGPGQVVRMFDTHNF